MSSPPHSYGCVFALHGSRQVGKDGTSSRLPLHAERPSCRLLSNQ